MAIHIILRSQEHQFRPVVYIHLTRKIYPHVRHLNVLSSSSYIMRSIPRRDRSLTLAVVLAVLRLTDVSEIFRRLPGSPSIWTPPVLRQLREQKLLDLFVKETRKRTNNGVNTAQKYKTREDREAMTARKFM